MTTFARLLETEIPRLRRYARAQNVNDVRRSVREGVAVPVEDVAPVLTATAVHQIARITCLSL